MAAVSSADCWPVFSQTVAWSDAQSVSSLNVAG